jgi:hypothetical protein
LRFFWQARTVSTCCKTFQRKNGVLPPVLDPRDDMGWGI